MSGPARLVCLALTLATAASCTPKPTPCDRLGQAYCEAAALPCDATKELFARAELPPAACEEGLATLQSVLPMLSPDTRGYGLAALLRELMRSSPKLSPEQIDALSLAVGLPPIADVTPGPGAPAPPVPPGTLDDLPNGPVFSGYMNTPDPPPPPPPT